MFRKIFKTIKMPIFKFLIKYGLRNNNHKNNNDNKMKIFISE